VRKKRSVELPELEDGSFDGPLKVPPPLLFDGRNLSTTNLTDDHFLEVEDAYEICIIATATTNGWTEVK